MKLLKIISLTLVILILLSISPISAYSQEINKELIELISIPKADRTVEQWDRIIYLILRDIKDFNKDAYNVLMEYESKYSELIILYNNLEKDYNQYKIDSISLITSLEKTILDLKDENHKLKLLIDNSDINDIYQSISLSVGMYYNEQKLNILSYNYIFSFGLIVGGGITFLYGKDISLGLIFQLGWRF